MTPDSHLRRAVDAAVNDYRTQLRSLRGAGAGRSMGGLARLADHVTAIPDALLLVQFYRRPPVSAEERLMLAILEDAVTSFQQGASVAAGQRHRLFIDACAWIFSRERSWPFSFENICETFNMDPGHVRCALAHWARCTLAAAPDAAVESTLRFEEVLACMQMRRRVTAETLSRAQLASRAGP